MSNSLTARQRRFVAEYQTGVDGTEAAKRAGYSPKSARYTAYHLLNENAAVMAEIKKVQEALAKAAEYNGEKCMAELNEAIAFAIEAKQPNAYVKAIETKARLAGLLRDKLEVTVEQRPDVSGALAAARARALQPLAELPSPIEGQFTELHRSSKVPASEHTPAQGGAFADPPDFLL